MVVAKVKKKVTGSTGSTGSTGHGDCCNIEWLWGYKMAPKNLPKWLNGSAFFRHHNFWQTITDTHWLSNGQCPCGWEQQLQSTHRDTAGGRAWDCCADRFCWRSQPQWSKGSDDVVVRWGTRSKPIFLNRLSTLINRMSYDIDMIQWIHLDDKSIQ